MSGDILKAAREALAAARGGKAATFVSKKQSAERSKGSSSSVPAKEPSQKAEKRSREEKKKSSCPGGDSKEKGPSHEGSHDVAVHEPPLKKPKTTVVQKEKAGVKTSSSKGLDQGGPLTALTPVSPPVTVREEEVSAAAPESLKPVVKDVSSTVVQDVSPTAVTEKEYPLELDRAIRMRETMLKTINYTPPVTVVVPPMIDDKHVKLVRDSISVTMCRLQGYQEMIEGLAVQSKNQSIMNGDLMSRNEQAAVELTKKTEELVLLQAEKTKIEESQKAVASDLAKIRDDATKWFAEKKQLLDRQEELEKELAVAQRKSAEAGKLQEDLRAAQEKTVEVEKNLQLELAAARKKQLQTEEELQESKDLVASVFVETFNNALAQVEIRNPELDINFEGLDPIYEVEGDYIVKKESDGTTVTIYPPVSPSVSSESGELIIPKNIEGLPPSLVVEGLPQSAAIINVEEEAPGRVSKSEPVTGGSQGDATS